MIKISRVIILAAAALVAAGAFIACKTTEENYRKAYEKAVAARDEGTDIDSTVYGQVRRQADVRTVDTPSGPVELRRQDVAVTEGQDFGQDALARYGVVAAQFKQKFNAESMRQRMVAAGFDSTLVVETAEPLYYVVVTSHPHIDQAIAALETLRASTPVALREPCPFILDAFRKRRKI